MLKLKVKWGKELFEVEADLSQPPLIFKSQLFALSGVAPERQKVVVKGVALKDDDWGKNLPKEGQTLLMMGSAAEQPTEAPKAVTTFVEDLPEADQEALTTQHKGAGLYNLGNTCYMNSTLQVLYSVETLRDKLRVFNPPPGQDPGAKLLNSARDVFVRMGSERKPVSPYQFLLALRQRFPQFDQTNNEGAHMQQDAEECWSQLLYAFRENLKDDAGTSAVTDALGVGLSTVLTCPESGEDMKEESVAYMLKCNIAGDTNFLSQGLTLGLKEDREKQSAQLGRTVLFTGSSKITKLPPYLTIQMVRFFYKTDVQQKAKILRKVTFPLVLDTYEFCAAELQQKLEAPRAKAKELEDAEIEKKKLAKKNRDPPAEAAAEQEAAAAGQAMDVDADAPSSSSSAPPSFTGTYDLIGVLTHKGRSADSGHYVSWIKQDTGGWVMFDDDKICSRTEEEVLALCGGGDWHMAYMLMYKARTVTL